MTHEIAACQHSEKEEEETERGGEGERKREESTEKRFQRGPQ